MNSINVRLCTIYKERIISMSDQKDSNLNSSSPLITVGDLISILNHVLPNQTSYVDKWDVIPKGQVKCRTLTNLFENKVVLKTEANLLIKNLGDRVTVYEIKAYFNNDCNKQRISATNLLININNSKNDFIVLDKGDVISINIIAVLVCHNKSIPLQSIKNLELVFSGTGRTVKKVLPLYD